MIISPYLNFNGNCEEAFNKYKSIFGGEFGYVGRFADMPPQEGMDLSEEMKNRIMHISLTIDEHTTIMGSDTGGEWAASFAPGNNFSLSITADSKENAEKIFNQLAEGGKVTMPLADTFWGDYFGMCTDKYDINWMMSFNEKAIK